MITHLEPDILECEVKWVIGSITTNKASGGNGIPVELFQILKDDAVKVLHSICQQIWKLSSGHRTGKVNFHSNPKERKVLLNQTSESDIKFLCKEENPRFPFFFLLSCHIKKKNPGILSLFPSLLPIFFSSNLGFYSMFGLSSSIGNLVSIDFTLCTQSHTFLALSV